MNVKSWVPGVAVGNITLSGSLGQGTIPWKMEISASMCFLRQKVVFTAQNHHGETGVTKYFCTKAVLQYRTRVPLPILETSGLP